MLPISRVPRGLNVLMQIFGPDSPRELEDRARAVVELTQLYGLTQWQIQSAANGALAEAGNVDLVVPANQYWALFSASFLIAKTATMTALRAAIQLGPDVNQMSAVASEELGPFGATETGAARVAWTSPYVRLLPPGSVVRGNLEILGTDATASVALTASIGVLG